MLGLIALMFSVTKSVNKKLLYFGTTRHVCLATEFVLM